MEQMQLTESTPVQIQDLTRFVHAQKLFNLVKFFRILNHLILRNIQTKELGTVPKFWDKLGESLSADMVVTEIQIFKSTILYAVFFGKYIEMSS